MTPLLEARGLTVDYPGRRSFVLGPRGAALRALDEVSLTIDAGETVAVVGESGSGKTTLGRCLVGLLPPTAGQVFFRGEDLYGLPPAELRRRRRAFQPIFQDPSQALPPHRRIGSIVAEPLVIHRLGTRAERSAEVAAALVRVGLGRELLDRLPHQLSGGQRQRVAIARALITRPELVVADEPVSALDAAVRRGILGLLADLRRELGLALVFVSHDIAGVEELAGRVAVLYAGVVVELGPAASVLGRPRHPYTASLVAATPRLPGALRPAGLEAALPLTPGAPRVPVSACVYAPRCPRRGERCDHERPVLGPDGVACHFPLREGHS